MQCNAITMWGDNWASRCCVANHLELIGACQWFQHIQQQNGTLFKIVLDLQRPESRVGWSSSQHVTHFGQIAPVSRFVWLSVLLHDIFLCLCHLPFPSYLTINQAQWHNMDILPRQTNVCDFEPQFSVPDLPIYHSVCILQTFRLWYTLRRSLNQRELPYKKTMTRCYTPHNTRTEDRYRQTGDLRCSPALSLYLTKNLQRRPLSTVTIRKIYCIYPWEWSSNLLAIMESRRYKCWGDISFQSHFLFSSFTVLAMRFNHFISLLCWIGACVVAQIQWPLRNDGLNSVVEWDHYSLIVNGQRTYIWSGEMHYWRVPVPELWIDILQKVKAAGWIFIRQYFAWSNYFSFNTVSFYGHWGFHSASADALDFENGARKNVPSISSCLKISCHLAAHVHHLF